MATVQTSLWHFTIEFDERKAAAHGTTVDELYDRVGAFVEPYGNVRVGRGTWQARDARSGFRAQCPAVCDLSQQRWVMQNVRSWVTFEGDGDPQGEDYLAVIRRVRPRLLCAE